MKKHMKPFLTGLRMRSACTLSADALRVFFLAISVCTEHTNISAALIQQASLVLLITVTLKMYQQMNTVDLFAWIPDEGNKQNMRKLALTVLQNVLQEFYNIRVIIMFLVLQQNFITSGKRRYF
jgi:hypothetical protein